MARIQAYLSKMSQIHIAILKYIDDYEESTNNFVELIQLFNNLNIRSNKDNLKSVLHILSNIADNHPHVPNFFDKIQKILSNIKLDIKKNFSNFSIFNVFKSNKRILLTLIEEQILVINQTIASILIKDQKYIDYLFNYLKPFLKDDEIQEIKQRLPKNSEKKSKIGENDNYICKLIRKDKIDDFVSYVKKENISLTNHIAHSIFETNQFLNNNYFSLIEYAAFFGSVKIVKYLHNNGVKLNSKLWLHAAHCDNIEMIHFLEKNKAELEETSYEECLEELIKCHQNDFVDYILKKHLKKKRNNYKNLTIQGLKYYNIPLIQKDFIDKSLFCDLCQYDYYTIVDVLSKNVDKNNLVIFNIILFNFFMILIKFQV